MSKASRLINNFVKRAARPKLTADQVAVVTAIRKEAGYFDSLKKGISALNPFSWPKKPPPEFSTPGADTIANRTRGIAQEVARPGYVQRAQEGLARGNPGLNPAGFDKSTIDKLLKRYTSGKLNPSGGPVTPQPWLVRQFM